MSAPSPDRRESNPLPAVAAVLVAVLAISVAGSTDLSGSRQGRPLQLGAMFLQIDGPSCCPALDAEHGDELASTSRRGPIGTPGAEGEHARILGPVVASGPAHGDLPPPRIA